MERNNEAAGSVRHGNAHEGRPGTNGWRIQDLVCWLLAWSASVFVACDSPAVETADRTEALSGIYWESLDPSLVNDPVIVASSNNRQDVFALGPDGAIYHRWWTGGDWQPTHWEYLGNNGHAFGPPAAVALGSRIGVFARDNATAHLMWRELAFGSWSAWQDLGGVLANEKLSVITLHGASGGTPFLTYQVFVRNTDNSLGLLRQVPAGLVQEGHPTTFWASWRNLGGGLIGAPTAVSWGDNRIDVFVRGLDNRLYHQYTDSGVDYTPGNYELVDLGDARLGTSPSAASWGANRLDVFYSAPDAHVKHVSWAGDHWSGPHDVAGGVAFRDHAHGIAAPTAAAGFGFGRAFAVVQGTDHGIYWTNMVDDGTTPEPRFSSWLRIGDCYRTTGAAGVSANGKSFNVVVTGRDTAVYHAAVLGAQAFPRLGTATPPACHAGGKGEVCGFDSVCDANLVCDGDTCACGKTQQPCCDGTTCENGNLCLRGTCGACGGYGELPCKNGCAAGLDVANGVCQPCGGRHEIACDAWSCLYPLRTVHGYCELCGAAGEPPCDKTGCDGGMYLAGGLCHPNEPSVPSCASTGDACVPDTQPGMHCCQNQDDPHYCLYGHCKPCVQHGEVCQLGGSQLCCSTSDRCVIDQTNDTAVCDIVSPPDKQ